MGLWRYALRELLRHPGRSIFTLTGIAIGVAAAVASFVAAQTARGHYRALFDGVAERASLEVYAPGEAGFDPSVAESLEQVPGVVAAIPEISGIGGMPSWHCSVPVVVHGHNRTATGMHPGNAEVLVPASLAQSHGMKPGGRLRLWGTAGQADLTISTTTPAANPILSRENAGVSISLSAAQQLFGLGENVNVIRVVLDDTANPARVRDAIATVLPPGLAVREPAGRADISVGLRAAALEGLTGLTAVALAGAGYIVFGFAQLDLLARRSEVATLRTLGASTQQVRGVFLRHAIILGVGGGVLGTIVGLLLAWGLSTSANTALGLSIASSRLSWQSVLLGLGTGLGVALAALWLPSWQLCRRPPLDLFRVSAGTSAASRQWPLPLATISLAIGVWLLAEIASGTIPPMVGRGIFPPALVLALAGITGLVAPQLTRSLAYLERPARVLFGIEGMLAVRQLGVRPERTTRAGGVVFLAVVMVVGFGHSVLNTLADVRGWTDRAIPAHFLVRGGLPDPGFVLNVPLPEQLGEDLRKIDGVARVEQISFLSTSVNDTPVLVLARTFPAEQSLPLDLRGSDPSVVRNGLANGEAILAESLAHALHLNAGDSFSLATPTGPRRIRVAGVVTEYAAGGMALYLDWRTATSLFGPFGVHVYLITAHADQRITVDGDLSRYCSSRGLHLQRGQEFRQVVDDLTRGLTSGLWTLLAVIIAIAAIGVANMVAVIAQEQQRDVQMLRTLGMSASRIGRAFRLQVMLLILIGLPAAVLCGIALALGLDRAINGLWGYSVPFQIQWTFLLETVGCAVIVAILSSLALRIRIRAST